MYINILFTYAVPIHLCSSLVQSVFTCILLTCAVIRTCILPIYSVPTVFICILPTCAIPAHLYSPQKCSHYSPESVQFLCTSILPTYAVTTLLFSSRYAGPTLLYSLDICSHYSTVFFLHRQSLHTCFSFYVQSLLPCILLIYVVPTPL